VFLGDNSQPLISFLEFKKCNYPFIHKLSGDGATDKGVKLLGANSHVLFNLCDT